MEHTSDMRVLLVEDEADVRRYFARALVYLCPRVEVVAAADGREALARLGAGAFDLVLSDQRMPNMTGLELLVALRSCSQVPFLLVSADPGVEAEAYAAGANGFLAKPVGLDTLGAAIARYLVE